MESMHWINRKVGLIGGVLLALSVSQSPAQLAKTPPMGFNTWNNFGCNVSQAILQSVADSMVSSGMKDAGYTYVNVDDCWEGLRDANGFIGTTSSWTGNGLKSVADYVHGKGMKFGMYTSLGSNTCANHPATLGFESQDVRQWVNWGVDYVKVDWCNVNATQTANPGAAYKVLGDTIHKYAGPTSTRPMLYSICNWGVGNSWTFGRASGGQMWRTTGDINSAWTSITGNLDKQVSLYSYAGPGAAGQPGGWNDPDMLEVGRGTLSDDENRSHFGMWCILAAPLIAGNDVRSMSTTIRNILINKEVIAIDQDSLGVQAQRISSTNNLEIWARPLQGNARAVALFNRSAAAATITVNWSDLDKWSTVGAWSTTNAVTVRDLWTHTDLATNKSGSFGVSVPSHGIAMLKLSSGPVEVFSSRTNVMHPVEFGSNGLRVNLPGTHSLQILDLTGRVLWQQNGVGPMQYWPSVKGDGSHILRLLAPESKSDFRY